jgi:pyrimidine deaminase RibD-like protein
MLDTDTLLMKRALELARRGAGLVSPNPLVGALLVNDGRLVGEGYHVFKRVRHAESYAIEAAGALARGATLYCNLEPCSHHGRTPPCAEALIEAKIARAVIAIKDPNPSVNGRGIEQLREAGIEVEVGLLEERAIRFNESYFKFVTSRMPFVHGVIEYPDEDRGERWRPSSAFVNAAGECDAIIAGASRELSRFLVTESLKRDRHRPLVIIADANEVNLVGRVAKGRDRERIALVAVAPQSEVDAYSQKVATFPSPSSVPAFVGPDLESALQDLARAQITSVISLPSGFDSDDPRNFALIDKVTLVVPKRMWSESRMGLMSIGELEFELKDVSITEADLFTELTGYPSLRGAA